MPSLMRIEDIPQEDSRSSSPIHLMGLHLYQVPPPNTLLQAPFI